MAGKNKQQDDMDINDKRSQMPDRGEENLGQGSRQGQQGTQGRQGQGAEGGRGVGTQTSREKEQGQKKR